MKKQILPVLLAVSSLMAMGQNTPPTDNQLPPQGEPGKCYVKCVTPDVWKNEVVEVLKRPSYKKYKVTPATYKTVTEKVMIKEASKKLVYVPAVYETQTVEYISKEGRTDLYASAPKIVPETKVVETSPAYARWEYSTYPNCQSSYPGDCRYVCWKEYPAQTKTLNLFTIDEADKSNKAVDEIKRTYTKQVIKTPATTREIDIPAQYKTISKQVIDIPAKYEEIIVPEEKTSYTKRVLVSKGGVTKWEEVECGKLSGEILPVYYKLGSAELTYDSKKVIDDKLYKYMLEHPNQIIEIDSHTDSRGSDFTNMDLSEKRAKSVVDYLIAKGIDSSRLIAKGYGETMLTNHCGNGVTCTEAQHQQNRRTEFRVINAK